MSDISIRPFELSDLDALYEFIPALWIEEGLYPDVDGWQANSREFFAQNLNESVTGVVATNLKDDQKMIACGFGVAWNHIPSFWNINGAAGFVQWFFVDPAYRGRGVGKAIAEDLIKWFDSKRVTRVFLASNPPSTEFWETVGFENHDEFPFMIWRKPGTEIDRSGVSTAE